MFVLTSPTHSVSVLDPEADRYRLGTRYCAAGFVFQVNDASGRPLLSGPNYPDAYETFGGQGAPDAFQPHLPLERSADGRALRVLGIGIGLIDTGLNTVLEWCPWEIERSADSLRFRTTQHAALWRFRLERSVTLRGGTLRVATRVENAGDFLPFQWYPHPFFPHHPTGECCRFNVPVTLPENPGYELRENGFVAMKGFPWKDRDHFQLVGHAGDRPLVVVQRHPLTGVVVASFDYVPTRLPIWGNRNTFSFEPYLERMLHPGEEARWSVVYDF